MLTNYMAPRKITFLAVFAAIVLLFPVENSAQEICGGKAGNRGTFVIKNELTFDVEVRFVQPDCKEDAGVVIGSGKSLEIAAFENQIYRVYENFTSRILTAVTLKLDNPTVSITGFEKSLDPNTKLCSKGGVSREISVRNASAAAVELRFVDEKCDEGDGPILGSGEQLSGNANVNAVIRAYDRKTGEFVSQIVVRQTVRNYVVGAEGSNDPRTGFLNTVNAIRKGKGLTPIELNKTLTSTCQWFADFMAAQDLGHAGHLTSEFSKDKKFKSYNKPEQRLKIFGWKGKRYAETTAVQTTDEVDLLGSHFALEWMSSSTHFKPFFDQDSVKYDVVGFAAAKSKKIPNAYYGCAIFGQKNK